MRRLEVGTFEADFASQLDAARADTVIITEDDQPTWALISYEVFTQLRDDDEANG
ncbi:hypothetical protein GCM10011494_34500 [Novosphingobium endophyticum]|uniref:Prevent-host-death protein n=1 Tax=Novosphingobium endophyticum TaxID=1955250 RepID=A0A916TUW6_9SPHN|nr:hypothetical protein [Novosphingobium endophyticum]GGC12765.1 hypothetical protein GCM10011494_34500 [Novosphingobium endophyticum]